MNTNHSSTSRPRSHNYILPSSLLFSPPSLLLLACLALFCACSSNDDGTLNTYTFEASGKPAWSVDLTGDDTAPQWQDFDRSLYESWMYVTVKLQDELAAHAGDGDLMTVFIGDEQRTRPAAPNIYADGSVYFVLTIGGNSTDREIKIRLCYWCAKLHQLFTIEEKATFTPELPYGNTSDYVPPLLKGYKKYPSQQLLQVSLPANVPFAPADGDMIGAFVGGECRGVGRAGQPFTVFCTSPEESFQLRYYSETRARVYSFSQPFSVGADEVQTVALFSNSIPLEIIR